MTCTQGMSSAVRSRIEASPNAQLGMMELAERNPA